MDSSTQGQRQGGSGLEAKREISLNSLKDKERRDYNIIKMTYTYFLIIKATASALQHFFKNIISPISLILLEKKRKTC